MSNFGEGQKELVIYSTYLWKWNRLINRCSKLRINSNNYHVGKFDEILNELDWNSPKFINWYIKYLTYISMRSTACFLSNYAYKYLLNIKNSLVTAWFNSVLKLELKIDIINNI